ncbi:hypothetical protein G7Y79_00039g075620 [Physcia stellaris]|nr:hypothetical protein G7Y79_00039g075620 [Physcia stellaris]
MVNFLVSRRHHGQTTTIKKTLPQKQPPTIKEKSHNVKTPPSRNPWIKSLNLSNRANPLPALFDQVASLSPSERADRLEKAYTALLADHIETNHALGKAVNSLERMVREKAVRIRQLEDIVDDRDLKLRKQEAQQGVKS